MVPAPEGGSLSAETRRPASRDDVAALLPAAGRATRLPGLACSKEIVPVGPRRPDGSAKAVCEYLLEDLATAGVPAAYVVLRPGKWDVAEHLGRLRAPLPRLAYLTIADSPGVPYTLDRAHPFVRGRRVVLGFPDILLRPAGAIDAVMRRQEERAADLVLGLFPTREPARADMVEVDGEGRVRALAIKQPGVELPYTWSIAVWTPRFTEHLHAFVARHPGRGGPARPGGESFDGELYVGHVIRSWIEAGGRVEAVPFPDGDSLDVGTPEALRLARAERGGAE